MASRSLTALLLSIVGLSPCLSATAPRNLVLITIDTLRADYLSCNGSTVVSTPHLDRLAREGTNFARARSPVPLTLPAHASIFTGNYPPTHTVRSNGEYRLPDRQVSLAEVLHERGYRTAAFLGSFVLDRRFGLAQGFDLYDDRVWDDVDDLEKLEAERTAEEVAAAFTRWLAEDDGAVPFFAWVHLYDPHAPYEPPEPFRSRYLRDPYAGEVAYADSVVGTILAELATRDRLSQTVIAVAGDHGEGLGEHGEMTHSLLIYNSTLHVPMMIWAPDLVAANRDIGDLVRLIDLAPTLLDYLGIEEPFGEGVSLRPLIDGGGEAGPEPTLLTAYSESYYPELALGWSPLRGLESGGYRLILAPTPVLFHVGEDPGERNSRVEAEPGVYQRLKRQLADDLRSFEAQSESATSAPLDAAAQERLRSLGYLAGAGGTSARQGPPVDPNQSIDLWNRIQRGIAELGGGDFRAAIRTFESVLDEDPEIPLVYEYLGTCWEKLTAGTEAEKVYRRALERGIESPRLHHEIGRNLLERGDKKQAERELQIALAMDPQSVVVHYDLGNLYRAAGRLPLAAEHYRAALEINPSYLWAWNGLGMTLAAMQKNEDALAAFQRVVEIDPEGAKGYFNLAVQLERAGQDQAALVAFQRFLELSADQGLEEQRRYAAEAVQRLGD